MTSSLPHSYLTRTEATVRRSLGDPGGTSCLASRQLDRRLPRSVYTASVELNTLLRSEARALETYREGNINLYLHVRILLYYTQVGD